MRTPLTPRELKDRILATGFYAQKQLFSKFRILSWSHSRRFEVASKMIRKFAPARLLDYGCGDGTFIALNLDFFPRSTGLDSDIGTLTNLKTRFATCPEVAFIEKLEDQAVYDLIVCMEVFEHCLPEVQNQILNTFQKHLTPEGHVLISVPIEIGFPLVIKQLGRHLAAFLRVKHYQYMETYTPQETLRAVFATEHTAFERRVYAGGQIGHKGFNWRSFKNQIEKKFRIVEVRFSPLSWLGAQFNSQVFFLCEKTR